MEKKANEEKAKYYTLLTKLGKIAISNAISLNEKVDFAYIALGDGGGQEYDPSEEQTELKGKKTENIPIGNIVVIEENSQIELQAIIGANIGGFTVREVGIYDSKGNLLAISKIAERAKPALSEGSGVDMFFKIRLEVSNTSIVNMTVDPSALLVNINQFNQFKDEIKKIIEENGVDSEDILNVVENSDFIELKTENKKIIAAINELFSKSNDIYNKTNTHIKDSIVEKNVHGLNLIDEELYSETSQGNVPIKLNTKNLKGNINIENITGKATIEEAKAGVNDTKYMTPAKVKDFLIGYDDGRDYIIPTDSESSIIEFEKGFYESGANYKNFICNQTHSDLQIVSRFAERSYRDDMNTAVVVSNKKINLSNYRKLGISDVLIYAKYLAPNYIQTDDTITVSLVISDTNSNTVNLLKNNIARSTKSFSGRTSLNDENLKFEKLELNIENLSGEYYIGIAVFSSIRETGEANNYLDIETKINNMYLNKK